ncbi:RuvX/YqgF family protein [bacterium]|nr:RuvX/YqgF family protein [bacterium]
MRWIGFDPGETRCGIAVCDPAQILASPVAVLSVQPRQTLAERIRQALAAYGAPFGPDEYSGMVCGLALDQRGRQGESARRGMELGQAVHDALKTEVPKLELHFVDERFSTAGMQRQLKDAGSRGKQRSAEIDAWAAASILDDFLQQRRRAAEDPT